MPTKHNLASVFLLKFVEYIIKVLTYNTFGPTDAYMCQ